MSKAGPVDRGGGPYRR